MKARKQMEKPTYKSPSSKMRFVTVWALPIFPITSLGIITLDMSFSTR